MVVGDDDVDARLPGKRDFLGGRDAAIDRYDEPGAELNGFLHTRLRHAIPFNQAIGAKIFNIAAEQPQAAQQNDRGGNAVDVVIAIDDDQLMAFNSLHDPGHGFFHIVEKKGVVEMR